MKIGIYCRVSTEEQKINGVSLDDQEKRGIDFCIQRGFSYEVFKDGGYSGTLNIEERPGLNILMEKIWSEPKEIDGVYVVDFDRLTRDVETGFVLKKTFQDSNILLYDSNGEVDLNDESQNLLLGIKILLSSFEIKKMKVRLKRSLERGVLEGRAGGGKLQNYGYKKGDNKILEIDNIESIVVKYIYNLCIKGLGTKKIATQLNSEGIKTKRSNIGGFPMNLKRKNIKVEEFIWKDAVIYKILTNPIYKGERQYKGKSYPAPQIINEEEFDLVQAILSERKNFKDTTNKHFYLLKGLIFCPNCNNRFYGRKRIDLSDNQYICSSQRNGNFCGNRGINIDKLNNLIWNTILSLPQDVKKLMIENEGKYFEKLLKNIELLKNQIQDIVNKKTRLLKLYNEGEEGFDFIKPEMEKLRIKNEELNEQLRLKNKELSLTNNKSELINILEKQISPFKNGDTKDEVKQKIIRTYVKHILVKWVEEEKTHFVSVDLSLSEKTEIQLNKSIEITYKQLGFTFVEKGVEYRFRKLMPEIIIVNEEGKKQIKYNPSKDGFGLRLNDKSFTEKLSIKESKNKE
jgi:site-specific DNA recombinase